MLILGIDPGVHCGIARYVDGRLDTMHTVAPHELLRWLDNCRETGFSKKEVALKLVVFEDSRLQSFVWTAQHGSRNSAAKIARNLGQVDGICAQIEAWCRECWVQHAAVSPKGKGSKMDAAAFKHFTGCTKRVNQHERDAALVAWPYRNLKPYEPEAKR